jgi:hypothetical protein
MIFGNSIVRNPSGMMMDENSKPKLLIVHNFSDRYSENLFSDKRKNKREKSMYFGPHNLFRLY